MLLFNVVTDLCLVMLVFSLIHFFKRCVSWLVSVGDSSLTVLFFWRISPLVRKDCKQTNYRYLIYCNPDKAIFSKRQKIFSSCVEGRDYACSSEGQKDSPLVRGDCQQINYRYLLFYHTETAIFSKRQKIHASCLDGRDDALKLLLQQIISL